MTLRVVLCAVFLESQTECREIILAYHYESRQCGVLLHEDGQT